MKVATATRQGDRLKELQAMRLVVAQAIDDKATPARDLAALTRRLIDIGKEVEELESRESDNIDDEEGDAPFDPATI